MAIFIEINTNNNNSFYLLKVFFCFFYSSVNKSATVTQFLVLVYLPN